MPPDGASSHSSACIDEVVRVSVSLNIAMVMVASAGICLFFCGISLLRFLARSGSKWIGQRTEAELAQMFVFIDASRLLRIAVTIAIAVISICAVMGLHWPFLACIAVVGVVAPRMTVAFLRGRRQRVLAGQLPDALATWAGLLRSGQGTMSALSQVATRQTEPLGAELRLMLSQCRLGMALEDAMSQFRDRGGLPELRLLATLLHANREIGGNLAEAMERLAATLRRRQATEVRIRTLTAQGRLQGLVVGILPLVLAAILCFMEPAAMSALASSPKGWAVIATIAALEACGFLLIRRIVSIEI